MTRLFTPNSCRRSDRNRIMTLRLPRLSDERFVLVIPAKADIQVLNVSRALRAISKANCGWLRPCTLGDFLLLVQEKVTKEKDTRPLRRAHRARVPTRPAAAGRSPTRLALNNAPRAQTRARAPLRLRCGARLAPTGMGANHLRPSRGGVFKPVWRARAS